jgi:hypothetical protein
VITTTSRLAGAIHSLQWNGKEFIDSADHGRQLQSACSFDNARHANAETFNPTEASVTFTVPSAARHNFAQFEALTGYMRSDFALLAVQSGYQQARAAHGPREIPRPVVLTTANGSHAMGIYAPQQPQPHTTEPRSAGGA